MKVNSVIEPTSFFEKNTLRSLRLSSSPLLFIIMSACFVSVFYNLTLWHLLFDRIEPLSISGICFLVAVFLLNFLIVVALTAPFISRYTLKPFLTLVFCVCGLVQYFNNIGIIIDDSMIRNIVETNRTEALELLSSSLLIHIVIFIIVPSVLVIRTDVAYQSMKIEIAKIVTLILSLILLIGILVYSNFQYVTFFGRENRDIRLYTNPMYPIYSVQKYLLETYGKEVTFRTIGTDATQVKTTTKPTVGVFVVGETARADHFSINGYEKQTTPFLEQRNLINFPNAYSCGTSTAFSVPCMFSFLNEENYKPIKANSQSNILDVLENTGIKTVWRDNNSSCKGVCDRVETESFRSNHNRDSQYYHNGEYLDEILLESLDSFVVNNKGDILIVLHPLGSHGPAYHRRYPAEFQQFMPSCQSNSPHNCTAAEVSNSYDNTILYTDYFLEKTIQFLESQSNNYNTFLMYVSDHGESLGENGVYLHGLPKSIAPKSQIHVPFFLWLSDEFRIQRFDEQKSQCTQKEISHDYIVHSLLSLFDVHTTLRDESKDVLNMNCDSSAS